MWQLHDVLSALLVFAFATVFCSEGTSAAPGLDLTKGPCVRVGNHCGLNWTQAAATFFYSSPAHAAIAKVHDQSLKCLTTARNTNKKQSQYVVEHECIDPACEEVVFPLPDISRSDASQNPRQPTGNPSPPPSMCRKCQLPTTQGGCKCDAMCNCLSTSLIDGAFSSPPSNCDKCQLPASQGGCACDAMCNCISTTKDNKCTKCDLPSNQGGCACDAQCNCLSTLKQAKLCLLKGQKSIMDARDATDNKTMSTIILPCIADKLLGASAVASNDLLSDNSTYLFTMTSLARSCWPQYYSSMDPDNRNSKLYSFYVSELDWYGFACQYGSYESPSNGTEVTSSWFTTEPSEPLLHANCSSSFAKSFAELSPDVTAADKASCGPIVHLAPPRSDQVVSVNHYIYQVGRGLDGRLPNSFPLAPFATLLYDNPNLCGSITSWPSLNYTLDASSVRAISATGLLSSNHALGSTLTGISAAELVLSRYMSRNFDVSPLERRNALFGLYNTSITLDLDSLSKQAPFYFGVVVVGQLGRGFITRNNLKGLLTTEQAAIVCLMLENRKLTIYNASNVPGLTYYITSDIRFNRAQQHYKQYLESQNRTTAISFQCGQDGKEARKNLIQRSVIIGLSVAAGAGAAYTIARYVANWCGCDIAEWIDAAWLLLHLVSVIADNASDWNYTYEVASSGSGWMLMWSGLLLIFFTLVQGMALLAWLSHGLLRKANAGDRSSYWVRSLMGFMFLCCVAWLVIAVIILYNFANPAKFSACLVDPTAICKAQTMKMWGILAATGIPAAVLMHLVPLLARFVLYITSQQARDLSKDFSKVLDSTPLMAEFLFFSLEDVPQFSMQTIIWYHGYAYVTPSAYTFAAVMAVIGTGLFFIKLAKLIYKRYQEKKDGVGSKGPASV